MRGLPQELAPSSMAMTDKQQAVWRRMDQALARAGMKSYALVAVDESGRVYWGSNFGHKPEEVLRHLRIIEADIRQYIRQG